MIRLWCNFSSLVDLTEILNCIVCTSHIVSSDYLRRNVYILGQKWRFEHIKIWWIQENFRSSIKQVNRVVFFFYEHNCTIVHNKKMPHHRMRWNIGKKNISPSVISWIRGKTLSYQVEACLFLACKLLFCSPYNSDIQLVYPKCYVFCLLSKTIPFRWCPGTIKVTQIY